MSSPPEPPALTEAEQYAARHALIGMYTDDGPISSAPFQRFIENVEAAAPTEPPKAGPAALPTKYADLADVFSKELARKLPPHRPCDLEIKAGKRQGSVAKHIRRLTPHKKRLPPLQSPISNSCTNDCSCFKQHKKRFPALQSSISVVYAHYAAQLGESAPERGNRFEAARGRPYALYDVARAVCAASGMPHY
ncbi:hypothetical protein HK105_207450 [Polyrhizophydium stewartii]|uniref:Uncharacterized protein n=1 Tax=Polyrhizophydium stewartii TaxID=2732419 RepID=A0ABR4N0F2_9FUNG